MEQKLPTSANERNIAAGDVMHDLKPDMEICMLKGSFAKVLRC
jgi:hypothetical protein